MIITDKAQIKIAELRESNNLRLSGSDELECYELIESDLKLPADATFTRSSVAYLSDGTQVVTNQPRFEQGKFGKAVMIEEETTNLVSNPSFESDFTSWNFWDTPTTAEVVTTEYLYGVKSFHLIVTNNYNGGKTQDVVVSGGVTYTVSVNVKRISGRPKVMQLVSYPSSTLLGILEATGSIGQWVRYVKTVTIPAGDTSLRIYLGGAFDGGTCEAYYDAVQLERKPHATSFVDGTRSAETLTIPTVGVLNPQEGEIEFWWNPLAKTPQEYPSLIATGQWTNPITQDWLVIYWGSGWSNANTVTFEMCNKNGTNNFNISVALNPQPYTWYYVVAKWSFVTRIAKLIIYRPDGTYVSTQATINGEPPTFEDWDKFYILQTWTNGTSRANSLIDDLRISSIARSDEEILAAYQSGKPLLADEWTTYKMDFDDKVRITTQGQIICNELIEI